MKKRVSFMLSFLFIIFCLNLVIATSNETMEEKAYSCLKQKVNEKINSLSLEEKSFSLLALAHDSSFNSKLVTEINKEKSNDCFPKNSCKVKDTALATLALHYSNQNTLKLEEWLISKKIKAKDIQVYLVIDSEKKSNCSVKWNNGNTKLIINEDKKITFTSSSCLEIANNGYWLRIKESCFDNNFTISCSENFITTLLYKKSIISDVWYVSSEVNSGSANSEVTHNINYFCFSDDKNNCNYEASLFASLALQQAGYDIKNFIPYLVIYSDDNQKLFPDAFLYYFTKTDDYIENILSLQKSQGYWDLNSGKGKFYDSAIALFSIKTKSYESFNKLEEWLKEMQQQDGCWNNGNIRDTSFLLWAGWPRPSVVSSDEIPQKENCIDKGYFCLSALDCEDVGGEVLSQYYCSGLNKCCSKNIILKKCSEMQKLSGYYGYGEICKNDEICSISTVNAADTNYCCLGECEKKEEESECESYNYTCRISCKDYEEEKDYECNDNKVCCSEKEEPKKGKGLLIFLLVLMIIIVILLIIFRNRIRIVLFKRRSGYKESSVIKTKRPPFPPSTSTTYPTSKSYLPLQRYGLGSLPKQQYQQKQITPLRTIQQPIKKPAQSSKKDEELEETMKKLRELSKE
ncbi:MAG: hypothetical protein QW117_01765 [Candidatus Pacearchaeota archaeon]